MKLLLFLLPLLLLCHLAVPQCLTDDDFRVDDGDQKSDDTFLRGASHFGTRILKSLYERTPDENVFFSPYSIFSALFLAYLGTAGNTAAQLSHVLGLQDLSKTSALRYNNMHTTWLHMRASGKKYDLNLANMIYVDRNETLRPCIEEIFSEVLHRVDFRDPAVSADVINTWVANLTNKKIQNLVREDQLDGRTRMILVNAAYFKGLWQSQFKKAATTERNFWLSASKYVQVPMMRQTAKFWYYASEELQAYTLMMPYLSTDRHNPDMTFIIVMPVFGKMNITLSKFTGDTLKDVREKMEFVKVDVQMPSFKVEQNFELRDILANLGIIDLFVPGLADLSTFTGHQEISMGSATHKAVIEVNEKGSEAAAATALVSFRTARIEDPIQFHCNRPFIYFIYDDMAHNVMFAGIYNKPV